MKISEILHEFQLPKNKWELIIADADKEELSSDLVSLVQNAYHNTPDGSFVNSVKDVVPSDWNVIDWDHDPDVDAAVFYRSNRPAESWVGYKIQGIGHDGTRLSKDKAISKIQEMLSRNGYWIETSDAMRHVLLKLGATPVSNEKFLQTLFKDPSLHMISKTTYSRSLHDRRITESVFGKPILNTK